MGPFTTIVIEHISPNKKRRTRLWLAEELDFVMVKLIQIKSGKIVAEAMIEKITISLKQTNW